MAKKRLEGQPERKVRLEYYEQLTHRNPVRRVAVLDEAHAVQAANRHVGLNPFEARQLGISHFVKVVAIKRGSERVLWTKLRIGPHLITQEAQQHKDKVIVQVPRLE